MSSYTIQALPPMQYKREGCAAAVLSTLNNNHKHQIIYILGGSNQPTIETYNISTNQWSTLQAEMSTPRWEAAAVSHKNTIIAIGGHDGQGTKLSSVEMYDATSQRWELLPPMNKARAGCAAAVVNDNKMVVVGGWDGRHFLSCGEEYDFTTRTWTLLSSATTRRRSMSAAVELNGELYVMGGYYREESSVMHYLSSVEVYNPEEKRWRVLPDMTCKRDSCAAVEMDGTIVVIGGYDGNNRVSSCEVYGVDARRWSSLAVSLSTKRSGCAAVVVDGVIYVIGGTDGSRPLSSMEAIRVQSNVSPSLSAASLGASEEIDGENKALSSLESLSVQPGSPQPLEPSSTTDPQAVEHIPSPSALPQTMQLLQEKIPTADFTTPIPVVTAEVIPLEEEEEEEEEETSIPQSQQQQQQNPYKPITPSVTHINQDLKSATTEQICTWLSIKHGITQASLDIIRNEEIDGVFLFTESFDEIKSVLKGEGMKVGQISRIRYAIEEARERRYL